MKQRSSIFCCVLLLAVFVSARNLDFINNNNENGEILHKNTTIFILKSNEIGDSILTKGERQIGDRLQPTHSVAVDWPSNNDVFLNITYPPPGHKGAVITFIQITMRIAGDYLSAVSEGVGIGERKWNIQYTIFNVTHFQYIVNIYGI